jgi:Uma2 family endonuclease
LSRSRPNIFVAGDLLWYPVEGHPEIRVAPNVLVAFDRPKGDRGSYRQWQEDNVDPQVVFEILSPGNTLKEMTKLTISGLSCNPHSALCLRQAPPTK